MSDQITDLTPNRGRFTYAIVPSAILFHPNMQIKAARLFTRIDFLANNEKGYCWASNDDLSYHTNQSLKSLENNLKFLEKEGFIRRELKRVCYTTTLTGKDKFKIERHIHVTLDKNKIPDYVPTIIENNPNDNNELPNNPPGAEGGKILGAEGDKIPGRCSINNIKTITNEDNKTLFNNVYRDQDHEIQLPSNFVRKKKKEAKPNSLIDEWNDIPYVRHHKESSKTYQRADILLNQLMRGTFSKKKEFDKKWLNGEISPIIDKKFDEEDLSKAIQNVSLYFKEGYWPEDKSRLPKDLPTLIYNPRSKKSLLLTAFKHPPRLLSETLVNCPEEKNESVTNILMRKLFDFEARSTKVKDWESWLTDEQWNELIRRSNEFVDYQHSLWCKFPSCRWEFEPDVLAKHYADFLDEYYITREVEPYMLGPKSPSKNWYKFLKYLGEVLLPNPDAYTNFILN